MKLSRAVIVVIFMHLVAVAGVLAFSLIQDKASGILPRDTKARSSSASAGQALERGPIAAQPVARITPAVVTSTKPGPLDPALRDAAAIVEGNPRPNTTTPVRSAVSPKAKNGAPKPDLRSVSQRQTTATQVNR